MIEYSIPDNYELLERNEAEKERALQMLPVCSVCGEHIQDAYYYDFGNGPLCEECKDQYLSDLADDARVENGG